MVGQTLGSKSKRGRRRKDPPILPVPPIFAVAVLSEIDDSQ